MSFSRVRSLLLCVLPVSLPLSAACSAPGDVGAESVNDGHVGVASQALIVAINLAGGGSSSLALRADGTVWACGDNGDGQLGDGTTTGEVTPIQVSGLSGVTAVTAGFGFDSLALKADGTVWAWGHNIGGELGDGTIINRYTPVQVSGLSGAVAVTAAYHYSLAVKSDGTVAAWGANNSGQLGDGTTTQRSTPVQVSGLSGVTGVTGGGDYSLAVKSDGTVWAWGMNAYGQLGDGTATQRLTPVQVSGLSGVTAVSAKNDASFALKSDGTVWAWGYNNIGQLGDGTTVNRSTPVQVSGLSGVKALYASSQYALVLKSDGTVWAWGYNHDGELGDGTTTNRTAPVQVSGISGVIGVSAGLYHALAQTSDGTVWAWGNNGQGRLGDGTTTNRHTPVKTLFDVSATWPMPNPVSTGLPNPASYTIGADSVVDNVTGLQWEQPALGCPSGCAQADAAAYCAGLALDGYGDWRLPTRIELISIVDDTQHFAAFDPTAFPGASSSYYKSSTPVVGYDDTFTVGGAEGDTSNRNVGPAVDTVRCVRGAVASSVGHYTTPGDGTVVDRGTGLTWQQAAAPATYNLADATTYCANNTAGLPGAGWRLPSMKELQTIVDDSQGAPAIDPNAFPSTPFDVAYWTSTPVAWQSGYAWYVLFNVGQSNHDVGGAAYHVRCVR